MQGITYMHEYLFIMCSKKVFGNNDIMEIKKFFLEYVQFLQKTSTITIFIYFCWKFQEKL